MSIDLKPYFKSKIGETLHLGKSRIAYTARYFQLLVISIDEDANCVYFEGWSGDASFSTPSQRYHGVTEVNLDKCSSIVEVQMIASLQLSGKEKDIWDYVDA
jgi:hypothetical protein